MTKKKKKIDVVQLVMNLIMICLCVCVIVPLLVVISISFSDEKDVLLNGYNMIPRVFSTSAYEYVFKNPQTVLDAYKITILVSFLFMGLGVFFMAMMAYPLSRKFLKGRQGMGFYLYFTMMFSGGLVPTYILLTQYLHMGDTIWVYILPNLISPWYVFMLRTFISQIPDALPESAYIDGASEFRIFLQIILPMSKSSLAAVALFTFLIKWNDWYNSMIYINDQKLISLQYLLQRIMLNAKILQDEGAMSSGLVNVTEIPTETTRMAMAVIAAGPALVAFPFFQKYFVKGVAVGAVKG